MNDIEIEQAHLSIENIRLKSELREAREEIERLRGLLDDAAETLIWASGAFQSEEEALSWAHNGRPTLEALMETVRAPPQGGVQVTNTAARITSSLQQTDKRKESK